jgi:plasmid stabilization system protein ParE
MKVAYSPRAVAQITQAFDYIAEDNLAAATAFLARVESIASLVSARPGIGRRTSKPDVQVVGLLPYRYLMFYKVLPRRAEVRIIRVRHMRRKDAADVRDL